jgi:hypothetical protein
VQVYNDDRRTRYHSDAEYADKVKKAARDNYRKGSPRQPSKMAGGLLTQGQEREVFDEDMDHPVVVTSYTVPEAAKALGRSELTFKKWIAEDLVPAPVLHECAKNYRVYSEGELRAIATVLAQHEIEFTYYSTKHEQTRHRLFQQVQAYRAHSV